MIRNIVKQFPNGIGGLDLKYPVCATVVIIEELAYLVNTEGKLNMLVTDLNSKGCRVGEPDKKIGNRGQLTSDIYFGDVEVPLENLIGEEGSGLHIAFGTLTYGIVGIGASGVGMAQ